MTAIHTGTNLLAHRAVSLCADSMEQRVQRIVQAANPEGHNQWTVERLRNGAMQSETFSKGEKVSVFFSDGVFQHGEVTGIGHVTKTAKIIIHGPTGDYHTHHKWGSIYKYNGPKESPAQPKGKQEAIAKVIDRVNKKNTPEGGWTDADAVPLAFQNYRSKASLATRVLNIVTAAALPDRQELARHDKARDLAQAIYTNVAVTAAALAEHKKNQADLDAAILLLLLLSGEEAYAQTHKELAKGDSGKEPTEIELREQAAQFAAARQPLLKEFSGKLATKLRETKTTTDDEATSRATAARELRRIALEESETMAATEAQATYGNVQLDRLVRAGFKTIRWATCEDERVRQSHVACGKQGAIPIGEKFVNGLRYPGETGAPPSETCNCRCWLVGGSRK